MKLKLLFTSIALLLTVSGFAQKTVGTLINEEGALQGYTLYAPMHDHTVKLVDMEGRVINAWDHKDYTSGGANQVNHAMLLENGLLLRGAYVNNSVFTGMPALHGRLELVDWNGDVVWEFTYSDDRSVMHHDFAPIYNEDGSFTILSVAYDKVTGEEAIALGRDTSAVRKNGYFSLDKIIEIEPDLDNGGGEVIWEWRALDHLVQDYDATKENYGVVANHPELLDFNYFKSPYHKTSTDWMHVNSVSYNYELDQVMFGHHAASQIIIIDHSTTTAEAASHAGGTYGKGGDILYRWGNPGSYGASGQTACEALHDAHWIPAGLPDAGKIMMFDNGYNSEISKIRMISAPQTSPGVYETLTSGTAYGPLAEDWVYNNGTDFWSRNMGNALRLSNGNTLINNAVHGTFFEVDDEENIVWKYQSPMAGGEILDWDETEIPLSPSNGIDQDNEVFKVYRYTSDYPGLEGKDLTPGAPVEVYSSVTIDTTTHDASYAWLGNAYNETGIYIESGHYLDLYVEQATELQEVAQMKERSVSYCDGELLLTVAEAQQVTMTICNLLGHQLMSENIVLNSGENRIVAEGLSDGVYIAFITRELGVNSSGHRFIVR